VIEEVVAGAISENIRCSVGAFSQRHRAAAALAVALFYVGGQHQPKVARQPCAGQAILLAPPQ